MLYRSFFLFIFSAKIFASDFSSNVADWIISEAPEAIEHIEQDRIYLNPMRICIASNQITLISDCEELIPLPSLFSSQRGLYIPTNSLNLFGAWKCRNQGCGYLNSKFVNACQKCGTPRVDPSQES